MAPHRFVFMKILLVHTQKIMLFQEVVGFLFFIFFIYRVCVSLRVCFTRNLVVTHTHA